MTTSRREFIEHVGASAMLGAFPLAALQPLAGAAGEAAPLRASTAEEFDFTWPAKLKGKKHRALFDCTEVESGLGTWRANFFESQYQQSLGAKASDIGTVLVLRHNAIVLAFRQDYWDKHSIGKEINLQHPLTKQPTGVNPVLFQSSKGEIPAQFDAFALPNFISRGGIVLACNLALNFFAGGIAQKTGVSADEARKQAVAALVPGVLLQPSGVFACVRAQEEGCHYVKGS